MNPKGRKKRHKLFSRGSSPAIIMLMAMLRILVPLGIITLIAAWFLTRQNAGLGAIRVTTSIPGADIYLAGTMTGYQSDTTLFKIPAGRNIVTVHKPGYVSEPEVVVAEVEKGRIAEVDFVLKNARTLGRADSIPPLRRVRQEIFSTGEPVQSIPPSLYQSSARRLVDYSGRNRSTPTTSRPSETGPLIETTTGDTGLATLATTTTAFSETQVTVSSIPDGAPIVVNGKQTERVTPYTFRGLEYGIYVFRLSQPGYLSKPDSITVQLSEDDQSELVAFDLAVDQSQPKPTLTVMTVPPAAGVRVNGRAVGVGKVLMELPYGAYSVEFSEVPGYNAPEKVTVNVTLENPHPEITGTYERLVGNSYLAILPSEDTGIKFEGNKLRIFVDNELLLDSPKQSFDATLLGRIPAGKRLLRVQYDDLVDDLHVNVLDGEVSEVTFRIESFLSKRRLRLRERDSMPLDKWEQKSRRLTVLSSS